MPISARNSLCSQRVSHLSLRRTSFERLDETTSAISEVLQKCCRRVRREHTRTPNYVERPPYAVGERVCSTVGVCGRIGCYTFRCVCSRTIRVNRKIGPHTNCANSRFAMVCVCVFHHDETQRPSRCVTLSESRAPHSPVPTSLAGRTATVQSRFEFCV